MDFKRPPRCSRTLLLMVILYRFTSQAQRGLLFPRMTCHLPLVDEQSRPRAIKPTTDWREPTTGKPNKYYVNDVEVTVAQNESSTSTPTADSSPSHSRTTPARPYARPTTSLDTFLNAWNEADRKQVIIEELASQGVFWMNSPSRSGVTTTPSTLFATSL